MIDKTLIVFGSFHIRWSSKMGIFHLTLTKIHEILWGERCQASELNQVGIFKIGPVFPKLWTFEILMFFKRIGPKNSWSFAVRTSIDCHSFILNIFIQYFAVKWKAPCWRKQHRKFFTGDLWTLVNRCYMFFMCIQAWRYFKYL